MYSKYKTQMNSLLWIFSWLYHSVWRTMFYFPVHNIPKIAEFMETDMGNLDSPSYMHIVDWQVEQIFCGYTWVMKSHGDKKWGETVVPVLLLLLQNNVLPLCWQQTNYLSSQTVSIKLQFFRKFEWGSCWWKSNSVVLLALITLIRNFVSECLKTSNMEL